MLFMKRVVHRSIRYLTFHYLLWTAETKVSRYQNVYDFITHLGQLNENSEAVNLLFARCVLFSQKAVAVWKHHIRSYINNILLHVKSYTCN